MNLCPPLWVSIAAPRGFHAVAVESLIQLERARRRACARPSGRPRGRRARRRPPLRRIPLAVRVVQPAVPRGPGVPVALAGLCKPEDRRRAVRARHAVPPGSRLV